MSVKLKLSLFEFQFFNILSCWTIHICCLVFAYGAGIQTHVMPIVTVVGQLSNFTGKFVRDARCLIVDRVNDFSVKQSNNPIIHKLLMRLVTGSGSKDSIRADVSSANSISAQRKGV